MALPAQLKAARLTDASIGNTIDDQLGNAEKAVADILGATYDTNVAAPALFKHLASGRLSVPIARVYNSAAQSIANATDTVVTFDSETADNDTIHSTVSNTGRLTATTSGVYLVVAQCGWDANASGLRRTQIRKNGATVLGTHTVPAVASININNIVIAVVNLAATDYVEMLVHQTSGGALSLLGTGEAAYSFLMLRIGDL